MKKQTPMRVVAARRVKRCRFTSKVVTAPVEQTVETTTIVSVNLWGQITVLTEADTGRDAIVIVEVGPLERRLFVLAENDLIADDRPEGVIAEDYYALTC